MKRLEGDFRSDADYSDGPSTSGDSPSRTERDPDTHPRHFHWSQGHRIERVTINLRRTYLSPSGLPSTGANQDSSSEGPTGGASPSRDADGHFGVEDPTDTRAVRPKPFFGRSTSLVQIVPAGNVVVRKGIETPVISDPHWGPRVGDGLPRGVNRGIQGNFNEGDSDGTKVPVPELVHTGTDALGSSVVAGVYRGYRP